MTASAVASVSIPYGYDTMTFIVPVANMGEVLYPNHVAIPEDGDAAIADALANPIGTPPLEALARGKRDIVSIADDLTRPTPVDRVLLLLLERLNGAGMKELAEFVGDDDPDDLARRAMAGDFADPVTENLVALYDEINRAR